MIIFDNCRIKVDVENESFYIFKDENFSTPVQCEQAWVKKLYLRNLDVDKICEVIRLFPSVDSLDITYLDSTTFLTDMFKAFQQVNFNKIPSVSIRKSNIDDVEAFPISITLCEVVGEDGQ